MKPLIIAFVISLIPSFSWAHRESSARVTGLFLEQLPPDGRALVAHLESCGVSGHLVSIAHDPLREDAFGIYYFIEKLNLNVFCKNDEFLFLRDRVYKKRMQAMLKEGTHVLVCLHPSPLLAAPIMSREPLAEAIRRAIPAQREEGHYLLLARWASFYDFAVYEKQIENSEWLLQAFDDAMKESKLDQEALLRIKHFIESARSTESAIIEIDEGGNRVEYLPNAALYLEPVTDASAYRQNRRATLLTHVKESAIEAIKVLKEIAKAQPQEFKRVLATIHSLVPMPTLRRLNVNVDFDFDLKSICARDLSLAIAEPPTSGDQH